MTLIIFLPLPPTKKLHYLFACAFLAAISPPLHVPRCFRECRATTARPDPRPTTVARPATTAPRTRPRTTGARAASTTRTALGRTATRAPRYVSIFLSVKLFKLRSLCFGARPHFHLASADRGTTARTRQRPSMRAPPDTTAPTHRAATTRAPPAHIRGHVSAKCSSSGCVLHACFSCGTLISHMYLVFSNIEQMPPRARAALAAPTCRTPPTRTATHARQ